MVSTLAQRYNQFVDTRADFDRAYSQEKQEIEKERQNLQNLQNRQNPQIRKLISQYRKTSQSYRDKQTRDNLRQKIEEKKSSLNKYSEQINQNDQNLENQKSKFYSSQNIIKTPGQLEKEGYKNYNLNGQTVYYKKGTYKKHETNKSSSEYFSESYTFTSQGVPVKITKREVNSRGDNVYGVDKSEVTVFANDGKVKEKTYYAEGQRIARDVYDTTGNLKQIQEYNLKPKNQSNTPNVKWIRDRIETGNGIITGIRNPQTGEFVVSGTGKSNQQLEKEQKIVKALNSSNGSNYYYVTKDNKVYTSENKDFIKNIAKQDQLNQTTQRQDHSKVKIYYDHNGVPIGEENPEKQFSYAYNISSTDINPKSYKDQTMSNINRNYLQKNEKRNQRRSNKMVVSSGDLVSSNKDNHSDQLLPFRIFSRDIGHERSFLFGESSRLGSHIRQDSSVLSNGMLGIDIKGQNNIKEETFEQQDVGDIIRINALGNSSSIFSVAKRGNLYNDGVIFNSPNKQRDDREKTIKNEKRNQNNVDESIHSGDSLVYSGNDNGSSSSIFNNYRANSNLVGSRLSILVSNNSNILLKKPSVPISGINRQKTIVSSDVKNYNDYLNKISSFDYKSKSYKKFLDNTWTQQLVSSSRGAKKYLSQVGDVAIETFKNPEFAVKTFANPTNIKTFKNEQEYVKSQNLKNDIKKTLKDPDVKNFGLDVALTGTGLVLKGTSYLQYFATTIKPFVKVGETLNKLPLISRISPTSLNPLTVTAGAIRSGHVGFVGFSQTNRLLGETIAKPNKRQGQILKKHSLTSDQIYRIQQNLENEMEVSTNQGEYLKSPIKTIGSTLEGFLLDNDLTSLKKEEGIKKFKNHLKTQNYSNEEVNQMVDLISKKRIQKGVSQVAGSLGVEYGSESLGRIGMSNKFNQMVDLISKKELKKVVGNIAESQTGSLGFSEGIISQASDQLQKDENLTVLGTKENYYLDGLVSGGIFGSSFASHFGKKIAIDDINVLTSKGLKKQKNKLQRLLDQTTGYIADPYELPGDKLTDLTEKVKKKISKRDSSSPTIYKINKNSFSFQKPKIRTISISNVPTKINTESDIQNVIDQIHSSTDSQVPSETESNVPTNTDVNTQTNINANVNSNVNTNVNTNTDTKTNTNTNSQTKVTVFTPNAPFPVIGLRSQKNSSKKIQGYNVYTRQGKRTIKIGHNLPFNNAHNQGKQKVDNLPYTNFWIQKGNFTSKKETPLNSQLNHKFSQNKTGGKLIYTEKKLYRNDSKQEKLNKIFKHSKNQELKNLVKSPLMVDRLKSNFSPSLRIGNKLNQKKLRSPLGAFQKSFNPLQSVRSVKSRMRLRL